VANNFLYDYIGPFTGGVDSETHPLILPKDTLAFGTNLTVRGGYIRQRPPVQRKNLSFESDEVEEAVTTGLFQGAAYYKPLSGTEYLVASFSGRVFSFTEVGDITEVAEIGLAADPNNETVTQVWMWQAERWLIIQNGLQLPLFWDGQTMRRSDGPSVALGTTALDWIIPPIGQSVTITLNAAYEGRFDTPIFIDGFFYQPIENPAGYNVELTTLYGTAGDPVAVGEEVVANPTRIGYLTDVLFIPSGTSNGTFFNGTISTPYTGADDKKVLISGKQFRIRSTGGNGVSLRTLTNYSSDFTAPAGTLVEYASSQGPNTVIGTIADVGFNTPAIGASVQVVLSVPYTGADGAIVYIGGAQFSIEAIPVTAPGATLTVINLTDTNNGTTGGNDNQRGPSYVAGTTNEFKGPGDLFSVPELPAGRMGAYGQGHVAMSLVDGLSFIYGDTVGGPAGTPAYNYRDSVLKMTENDFLSATDSSGGGRGAFRIPSTGDTINAVWFIAILDAALGQGPLQVGTANRIFSCNVPADRTEWIDLTQPILTESLIGKGPLGQNSTHLVNSDTFFRSEQGVASLILARREFANEWGNTTQSEEMQRIISLDDKSLLAYSTAIEFDNRYLQSVAPNASNQGVFHAGTIVMNLDPLSSLRNKAPALYDGLWTGLNVLQYVKGRILNVERCFAFSLNVSLQEIELYEVLPTSDTNRFDNGSIPIITTFETACLFRGDVKPFSQMCKLMNGEIYVKNVVGRVDFKVQWKPDFYPCWIDWHEFSICANATTGNQKPGYRTRLGLGEPPNEFCEVSNDRPLRIGHVHQFRVMYQGFCDFMGARFASVPVPHTDFAAPECRQLCFTEPDDTPYCYPNSDQYYTAQCEYAEGYGYGYYGDDVTAYVGSGTVCLSTQEEADALAYAIAVEQAAKSLRCFPEP
jgi:hypothetical protein